MADGPVHAPDTADAADPERHGRHDRAAEAADPAAASGGVRAAPSVARMPARRVLSLQRRAGNRAVAALVQPGAAVRQSLRAISLQIAEAATAAAERDEKLNQAAKGGDQSGATPGTTPTPTPRP